MTEPKFLEAKLLTKRYGWAAGILAGARAASGLLRWTTAEAQEKKGTAVPGPCTEKVIIQGD